MNAHGKDNGHYDAIVVGARVAGAATAMLLARRGLRVLAIDRAREGSDTVSTHALMRGGVRQLQRWGVLDTVDAAGTPAIRSATFHYADELLRVPIEPRDGVDGLRAPLRTVIDPILVAAARHAGAEVRHETRLTGLLRADDGRVTGIEYANGNGGAYRANAGLVIGADGLRSQVAEWVGAEIERAGTHATGVIYGHFPDVEQDGYHWHFRPNISAGVIPTNGGLSCIFVGMPPERFLEERTRGLPQAHTRILAEFDAELAAQTSGTAASMRAFPGHAGFIRRSWGRGWALVGDAGYFKDPITAHGITDALRDAELLANAIASDTEDALAAYQATRDDLAVEGMEISDVVAAHDWTLDEVQAHHGRFSKYMSRELKVMRRAMGEGSGTQVS